MSPIKVSSTVRRKTCSVTKAGIGLPQAILNQLRCVQGRDRIQVGFIETANCSLPTGPTQDEYAFLLSYANSKR